MEFNIDLGSLLSAGFVLALSVLIVRNNHLVDKKIEENRKELDEKKTDVTVCRIINRGYEKDIGELKEKVDCIPEIKAGVDLLLVKNGIKRPG